MSNNTVDIKSDNFEDLVIKSEKLVILDFWAEWCGPCKAIAPILDEISNEFSDKVLIGKVNIDKESELAEKNGIRSIPTLFFFRNGEIVHQEVGLQSKQALVDNITRIIEGKNDLKLEKF